MNLGGEPERDDSGLPPVDIVVPDDARELERDVQAYRREQRALRRQRRRLHWHGPLTRDGVVLPLLATCLILALIAGTLLTFFTARPGGEAPAVAGGTPKAGSASAPAASSSPGSSATPGTQGDHPPLVASPRPFPAQISITVNGAAVPRPALTDGMAFVLIPVNCNCGKVLAQVVAQAEDAHVIPYMVGGGKLATAGAINTLLMSNNAQTTPLALDPHGTLATTYLPALAITQGSAPSLLLVRPDGAVSVVMTLPENFQLTGALRALSATATSADTATKS